MELQVVPLIITMAIMAFYLATGFLYRTRVAGSVAEYMVAGRNLGTFVCGFTIYATFLSAMIYIGGPGLAYRLGLQPLWLNVLSPLTGMLLVLILVAAPLRRFGQFTITDYLARRYDSQAMRFLVAIFVCGIFTFAMVPQLIAGGLITEAITGLSRYWGTILFGLVLLGYVSLGGMRAVTLTDVVQGVLMFLGILVAGSFVFAQLGGVTGMVAAAAVNNPKIDLPNVPMLTYWGMIISFTFGTAAGAHVIMRLFAASSAKVARRGVVITLLLMAVTYLFGTAMFGVAGWAVAPGLQNPDLAAIEVFRRLLPTWLLAWMAATVVAAAMSTTDSMLLASVSSVTSDIYHKLINPQAAPGRVYRLSFIFAWILGLIAIGVALYSPAIVGWFVIIQGQALGATFFFPLVIGLWWKRATFWGAAASMVGGLFSFILLQQFGNLPLFGAGVIAVPLSAVLLVVVSLFTRPPRDEIVYETCTRLHEAD